MSPTEGPSSPNPAPAGKSTSAEDLRGIVARGLDEETALQALDATLDGVKLRHGALLLYDAERQSLTLLAQRNLSEEAQKAMRKIQRGVAGSWDMPLHSLIQRRVYMIERPKENPFVPPLLEGTDQNVLSNLVFLPLYSSGQASGVLLLAGSGARAIREPDIVALREFAKVLGSALAAAGQAQKRGGVEMAAPAAPSPALDRAALTARIAELEALVESLRRAPAATGPSPEAERRLQETTHERDRLQARLEERELELVSLRSEVTLLRDRGTGDSERWRKLSQDLSRAREQLGAISERERLSTEGRERAERARSELELRVQGLERRLAKSADHAKEGQTERAALSMRVAEAQNEAEELRKQLTARDTQLSELRADRERLASSFQGAAERAQESQESLNQLREDTEERIIAFHREIDGLRDRLLSAERERDALRAGASGQSGVVEEIERETEAIRVELARETERRRAAEDTSASVIRDAAALREDLERAQNERFTLERTVRDLRAELERLAGDLNRERAGAEDLGGSLRAAQDRAGDFERRFAQAERERAELESEISRLQAGLESDREREQEILARASNAEGERQKLQSRIEQLEGEVESIREESTVFARERDAARERANGLDSRIETLLREADTARAARSRHEQEAESLRSELARRDSELGSLQADAERLREALHHREQGERALASSRDQLEQQVAELRNALEGAQAQSSRLTEELETHLRAEEELRASHAALESEVEKQRERLRSDSAERQELNARLREMEEVLRGASPELGATQDLDALSMLRETLERSESARHAAEESVQRLESSLRGERAAALEAREQAESERQTAGELASRLEELQRRLHQIESGAEAAARRAEDLAAEQAAAAETSKSIAAELGRRTAEIQDLQERLKTRETELHDARGATEHALERVRSLEEAARAAAAEVASSRHQLQAAQTEAEQSTQERDLRIKEAEARTTRLEEQLASASQEHAELLERIRTLESSLEERDEALREATSRSGDADSAIVEARSQTEKITGELEALRAQAASTEAEIRSARAEAGKWQALNEKLQRTLEERDRDLVGLRGALAAIRKRAPEAAAATAAEAPAPSRPAAKAPAAAPPSEAPPASRPVELKTPAAPERTVVIFDEKGPAMESLSKVFRKAGLEPTLIENGSSVPGGPPELVAVNLLAAAPSGLDAIHRSRVEEGLRTRPLLLYAAKPGSEKGILLHNVNCLVRPIDEADFTQALSEMIGKGKRVTIIGEELDSVLRFNGWASSTGCSVSSAGDLKQGNDLLEIVKPDLIVFDFSRLSGEGAGLIVKVRRAARLTALPVLLVLPEPPTTPAAGLFLKRLATLAEETPFDPRAIAEQLRKGSGAEEATGT